MDIVFKFENTLRKRLVKNKLEKDTHNKGVYIIPCRDCDNLYVGETGRSLSVRLDEHKRACASGQENNAVATHSLSLDHRIYFKNSKIIYKESNVTKRRVVEGALIHSLNTFKNNKSFCEEDDILSNMISSHVLKSDKAAHTLVVSSLSHAQALDEVALQRSPDAGTDAENIHQPRSLRPENDHQQPSNRPVPRRSQRIRQRQLHDLNPD